MEKYNIIPLQFVAENREAKSAEDAIIDFATNMNSDMNAYFKAVPAEETSSEIAKQICQLIKSNNFSADECSEIFRALAEQSEAVGGKFWTTEDIKNYMEEHYCKGEFDVRPEWIDEIWNNIDTDTLTECTDAEWEVIRQACIDAGITIKVTGIEWDVDEEEFDDEDKYREYLEALPTEVEIPIEDLEFCEDIADYLSDRYENCIKTPGNVEE